MMTIGSAAVATREVRAIDYRQWAFALVMAAAAHVGLVFVFPAPDSNPPPAGIGGVEIGFAPATWKAGTPMTEVTREVSEAEAVEPVSPLQTAAIEAQEAVEEVVPVAVEAQPVAEPLQEVPPVEPEPANKMKEVVEEVAATEPPPKKPAPTPVKETKKAAPPPPKPERPKVARPSPQAQTAPSETAPAPSRPDAAQAGARSTEGRQSARRGDGGTAEKTSAGASPGTMKTYFAQISAWLERHKEYPRRARMRRQEGTVLVRFVIDRSGQVISHEIEKSSGHPLLDEEVARMLRRANPLPAMPAEMPQPRLELVLPVSFALR